MNFHLLKLDNAALFAGFTWGLTNEWKDIVEYPLSSFFRASSTAGLAVWCVTFFQSTKPSKLEDVLSAFLYASGCYHLFKMAKCAWKKTNPPAYQ